jgi:hypothetical protein
MVTAPAVPPVVEEAPPTTDTAEPVPEDTAEGAIIVAVPVVTFPETVTPVNEGDIPEVVEVSPPAESVARRALALMFRPDTRILPCVALEVAAPVSR